MPQALSFPGVYIEEIPSGVRTIIGVPTSIVAFIGRTRAGPANEPTTIFSFDEFERQFGGLWPRSSLEYALRDFYINSPGGQAIIVRTPVTGADKDKPEDGGDVPSKAKVSSLDFVASSPGSWGNGLRIIVEHDAHQALENEVKKAEAQIQKAEVQTQTAKAQIQEAEAQIQKAKDTGTKEEVTKAEAQKVKAEAALKTAEAALKTAEEALKTTKEALKTAKGKDETERRFNLTVRLVALMADDAPLKAPNGEEIVVAEEIYRGFSVRPTDPQRIDRALARSRLVRLATKLDEKLDRPATTVAPSELKDGSDATGDPQPSDIVKGLGALEKVDIVNLICIPPLGRPDDTDPGLGNEILSAAISRAQQQRAMLILDPPTTWDSPGRVLAGLGTDVGDITPYAAVFFPRIRKTDSTIGGGRGAVDFAPCGAVAGVFARTDLERGVWKAPAGLDAVLRGAPELSVNLTDNENGLLNLEGVNCLRVKTGPARVVWGARTRIGDDDLASEWKYIPVRRLANFIEESLFRGSQWVVFEPNDEPLWASIRLNVGSFMHSLFRQGAFQGATPREAYFVKCDKFTTTQDDINRGVVNIVVGFAPLKPAEFVVIKLQQIAGTIET